MKKIIIVFSLLFCGFNSNAQNTVTDFYRSDTIGSNFGYMLVMNNADFSGVNKIGIFKHITGNTEAILIKEIQVSVVGNYFLLKDGDKTNLIQNIFNTSLYTSKNNYADITKFSLKLFKDNGMAPLIIDITKPN